MDETSWDYVPEDNTVDSVDEITIDNFSTEDADPEILSRLDLIRTQVEAVLTGEDSDSDKQIELLKLHDQRTAVIKGGL